MHSPLLFWWVLRDAEGSAPYGSVPYDSVSYGVLIYSAFLLTISCTTKDATSSA